MAETIKYSFEVRPLPNEDGNGYLVTFPDLPGCMSDGDTIEEAIANAMDAEHSWIETAKEFGDAIPEPGQYSGKWVQRVPKSIHARLAARSAAEGVSINAMVAAFIAEGLGKQN